MANRSLCRVIFLLLGRQQIIQRQRFQLLVLRVLQRGKMDRLFISVLEKEYETK